MANEKISELPSGAPAQGGDALVIARGGSNYSVAASQVAGLVQGGINVLPGGNTAGNTGLIYSGTLSLAGGNNITLSQNGNQITISGGTVGPAFSGGVSTGGNTAGATGVTGTQLVFAGGNNITLSQTTGAAGASITISGANQLPVVNASVGGNTTGTLALISSGTLSLVGGNNVTLSQVGNAITISAGTANPANLTVSAGGSSNTYGGITLSNSNGVSFGLNNGTITASISQSVQTQNVIDVTLGGNTSGTLALISSGTMFLAGGNNVTLSQVGNSVTISANTAAAATLSVSAGASSGAFGGITLSNSNNVAFGLNNGTITAQASAIVSAGASVGSFTGLTLSNSNNVSFGVNAGTVTASASQSVQTQASGNIAGTGITTASTAGSVLVGTQNTAGISLGVPKWLTAATGQFSGGISNIGNTSGNTGITGTQLVLAGGNNVTLSQVTGANGATVTISGGSQSAQSLGVYALSQTVGQSSSSTVDARSFSYVGQGIVSVGLSGASLLISGNQTNQSIGLYASSQTTAQSSSQTVDARSLTVVGAGIISVGMSQQSLIISGPASAGISQSLYGVGNTTQSSSGTGTFASLVVQGAGNVSVGVSNGSLVISGAGGGGAGAAPGMSTFGHTAGTTGTFSSGTYVLVGTGPITLSQSTNTNGATISINGPATSSLSGAGGISLSTNGSTILISYTGGGAAGTQSLYGTGNTTQSSSGTASLGSLLVQGAGGVSVGVSNGSLVISGPTSAGGGAGAAPGMSTFGNTAGTTGTFSSGTYVLAGTGPISLSQSTGAGGATISIGGPATSTLSGLGGITVSTGGSTISLSVAQISSLSALGGFSVSANGSTITMYNNPVTRVIWPPDQLTAVTAPVQGAVSIQYVPINWPVTASRIDALMSWSGGSSATNATMGIAMTAYCAIFTRSGSTLSGILGSSGSMATTYSYASGTQGNVQLSVPAVRPISVPVNASMTPGEYFIAYNFSTNTTSVGATTTSYGQTVSMMGGAGLGGFSTLNYASEFNAITAVSRCLYSGMGVLSVTSAGIGTSLALSDIVQTGASLSAANIALVLRNG
jgi:fibronectin-binding autotransporter adhesin